jgi:hypothetical protein
VANQEGQSSLQDGGRHSAHQIRGHRHGRDFRVQEDPRPSVKAVSVSKKKSLSHKKEGGRFHTKSPILQISTAFPHFIFRIISGARYGTGIAFPLCSPPIRACPKSQMVSGPAPPSINRET